MGERRGKPGPDAAAIQFLGVRGMDASPVVDGRPVVSPAFARSRRLQSEVGSAPVLTPSQSGPQGADGDIRLTGDKEPGQLGQEPINRMAGYGRFPDLAAGIEAYLTSHGADPGELPLPSRQGEPRRIAMDVFDLARPPGIDTEHGPADADGHEPRVEMSGLGKVLMEGLHARQRTRAGDLPFIVINPTKSQS